MSLHLRVSLTRQEPHSFLHSPRVLHMAHDGITQEMFVEWLHESFSTWKLLDLLKTGISSFPALYLQNFKSGFPWSKLKIKIFNTVNLIRFPSIPPAPFASPFSFQHLTGLPLVHCASRTPSFAIRPLHRLFSLPRALFPPPHFPSQNLLFLQIPTEVSVHYLREVLCDLLRLRQLLLVTTTQRTMFLPYSALTSICNYTSFRINLLFFVPSH